MRKLLLLLIVSCAALTANALNHYLHLWEHLTTCNDLTKVVYTRNGDDVYNTTQTNAFSTPMALEAGKYNFKSSVDQTIAFTPASYTYTIGEPTASIANGSYIQQIGTVTFTFNPSTDDPNPPAFSLLDNTAKPTLGSTDGTFSLEGNVLTATFSGVTLDPASQYTLTIPAGTVGFEGQVSNETITQTLNTPSVFDGTYYLYDASAKLFLARGGNWGIEAVADKYGVPFYWKTGADGVGSIEFIDYPNVFLFISGTTICTDGTSTGWKFVEDTNGYKLCKGDGTVYVTHDLGNLGEYLHTTTFADEATVWTIMNKDDHDAIVDAYPEANKASVMTAANVTGDLDTYISTMIPVDMTDMIGTATFDGSEGDWTFTQVRRQNNQPAYGEEFCEALNATGFWTQTISDLPQGIYKVTVNGFERRTNNQKSYSLGEQGYNLVSSNMVANGEQVRFASWFDAADSNYNPNNTEQAVAKFEDGQYLNELYTYVGDDGQLTITINKPNYVNDCWTVFNNFTLMYYEPVEVTITDVGWATIYFGGMDLAVPNNVNAYIVSDVDGNTLSLTPVTSIPLRTGVIIEGPAGTYKFDVIEEATPVGENKLKGSDDEKTIAQDGHKYYMLSTMNGKVGFFYQVPGGGSITNGAHKAYLDVDTNQSPANYYLLFNEADGISNATISKENNDDVYTISGVRVNGKLAKGVYIIDGKKKIIK